MTHNPTHALARLALLLAIPLSLAGCFNSSETDKTLNLGAVSVGQQLMDLETARSAGLLSDREHRMIRDKLVAAIANMNVTGDDDDDDKPQQAWREGDDKDDEGEDGFSWF